MAVREPMAKGAYTGAALFPERDGRREGQGRGPGKGHSMVTVYFWAAVSSRLTVPPVLYGLRFLYRLRFLTVTGSLWSTVSVRFRGSYFSFVIFFSPFLSGHYCIRRLGCTMGPQDGWRQEKALGRRVVLS